MNDQTRSPDIPDIPEIKSRNYTDLDLSNFIQRHPPLKTGDVINYKLDDRTVETITLNVEPESFEEALTNELSARDKVYMQCVEHPLFMVLMAAIEQAMYGKGERHGGNVTPFEEQPWVHYAKMHGRGFLTGQAAKKLEEAASKRCGAAFETEVLGAIVYAGMAILKEREKDYEQDK